MSQKVSLPPGCSGFTTADGGTIKADKPGGSVELTDRQASALNKSQYAEQDFIKAGAGWSFGTHRGMFCAPCAREWNAWNDVCPKCGGKTVGTA